MAKKTRATVPVSKRLYGDLIRTLLELEGWCDCYGYDGNHERRCPFRRVRKLHDRLDEFTGVVGNALEANGEMVR